MRRTPTSRQYAAIRRRKEARIRAAEATEQAKAARRVGRIFGFEVEHLPVGEARSSEAS